MKIKIKLRSLTLTPIFLVLFLILVSSVVSASITETRITNHGTASSPDIYKNNVVWQDNRNGNWNIYTYDLETHQQIHTTEKSEQVEPAIYGNKIVWTDSRNKMYDIYMEDLSTKKQTQITTGQLAYYPTIYNNKIVWMEGHKVENPVENGSPIDGWNIFMYDISNKIYTPITTSGTATNPVIYGNKIVGADTSNGVLNIHIYDIGTRKETPITFVNSGAAFDPVIYGNKIVWTDNRNWNWDIYMYDLSTKKETQITTNSSDSMSPSIYGNTIVWQDNRSGNWDIYAYDLITHQQIHTTDKSDQIDPAIYDNKIVWTDYRNGNPDIYMGTISFLPVANFTASLISGTHPLNVQFNDKSTDAYYWLWDFGDKTTSTLQSPTHKYSKAGKYSVTLTVKNAAGKNTMKKANYISVK